MLNPDANAPPFNPLPQVVILLALLIAAPEIIFQLGEAGLIGAPTGSGWRFMIANQFGFSNQVMFNMWEAGHYPMNGLIRFVGYMFVHPNVLSAVFSVVFVLSLGKFVGERMSWLSVLVIYFGSGIFGP